MSEVVLAAELRSFIEGDPADHTTAGTADSLAYQPLYIEEPVLGREPSRFVGAGGVRLNSVQVYEITPDNLGPFAVKRRGLADFQLELLKFRFTIDQLPPGRTYTSVTVNISLAPLPQVLMFVPGKETTVTEREITSDSEFTLDAAARLLQLHLAGGHGKTLRRTEQSPVVTALDLNESGFRWKFEAQEGAPLFPQSVTTQALIQVPRGTKHLSGEFDSEAQVRRRLIGDAVTRQAKPVDARELFDVDLTAPPLR